jgi:hypothetical protein
LLECAIPGRKAGGHAFLLLASKKQTKKKTKKKKKKDKEKKEEKAEIFFIADSQRNYREKSRDFSGEGGIGGVSFNGSAPNPSTMATMARHDVEEDMRSRYTDFRFG